MRMDCSYTVNLRELMKEWIFLANKCDKFVTSGSLRRVEGGDIVGDVVK